MLSKNFLLCFGAAILVSNLNPLAHADDTGETYTAEYFEDFAPRSAFDMLARIPGFTIAAGDTGRRGLGQGGANVLVNGERISGKNGLANALTQIQATSVQRIEILDGASLSIPGLSGRVANITVTSNTTTVTWEWSPVFQKNIQPAWQFGRVDVSGTEGNLTWTAFAEDSGFRSGGIRQEQISSPTLGEFQTRSIKLGNYSDRPGIGGSIKWSPDTERILNIETELNKTNFRRQLDGIRMGSSEIEEDTTTRTEAGDDGKSLELAADYQTPFWFGSLKAIGIVERSDTSSRTLFQINDSAGAFRSASGFEQDAQQAETIGRLEYGWKKTDVDSWQAAIEYASNRLDIEQFVSEAQIAEDFQITQNNRLDISEDRYEANLTRSRKFSEKLDVQASVGLEYSTLSQLRGGQIGSTSKSFLRPKGFASAAYSLSDKVDVRARLERKVGQLNFFDFVASVDIENNQGSRGNPDLVPEQTWAGETGITVNFLRGSVFDARIYGEAIEDIIDRIPIGANGDGIGNLNNAVRYGLETSATLKGDGWGWKGVEGTLELELRHSTVEDPLLDFDRRINGDLEHFWAIRLRHDIEATDWAYGFDLSDVAYASTFRTSAVDRFQFKGPGNSVFLEHKDVFGVKIRAELVNLLGREEIFDVAFFDDRRDLGVVNRQESRQFEFGPILNLELSGAF